MQLVTYLLPQLLISKRNTIRPVSQCRPLFFNELPKVFFVKWEQRAVLVCERALPPVAEHNIKLNLLHFPFPLKLRFSAYTKYLP